MIETEQIDMLPVIERLDKDVKKAAETLTPNEVRYLVDAYYIEQENRKRQDNQVRALSGDKEPHSAIAWVAKQSSTLECRILGILNAYANSQPVGRWAIGVTGIGPVISSGLLAYIDLDKSPTVGHIWRYAGYDPTQQWIGRNGAKALIEKVIGNNDLTDELIGHACEAACVRREVVEKFAREYGKGKITQDSLAKALSRCPWNARLKVLCWKIGESFNKTRNRDGDVYGHVLALRSDYEHWRNDNGEYAEQAADKLKRCKIGKSTEAYKWYSQGKLPPGHILARCKRYAVKLFLSHWHEKAWEFKHNAKPPVPYICGNGHHLDFVSADNAGQLITEMRKRLAELSIVEGYGASEEDESEAA